MFKKPPTVKPATPLRSSARRSFLAHLQLLFPILQHATPEQILLVVPNVLKQCGARTSSDERAVIYTDDSGTPLWFELGHDAGAALLQSEQQRKKSVKKAGKEALHPAEVIPSLYVLWRMPQLLPRLPTWPQIVDPVLLSGSALMIPGLIPDPNTFPDEFQWPTISEPHAEDRTIRKYALVSITPYPSLVPMAVARLEDDVRVLIAKRKAGEKGKAAVMLHCAGDHMMSLGGERAALPSEDEAAQRVVQVRDLSMAEGLAIDSVTEGLSSVHLDGPEAGQQAGSEPSGESERRTTTFNAEEVDEILHLALLSALGEILVLDGTNLPMSTSALYSNHVLPNRPAHWPPMDVKGRKRAALSPSLLTTADENEAKPVVAEEVDVHHSSAKKLAKWLKAEERKGLIRIKEVKGKDAMLTSIDARHVDMLDTPGYFKLAQTHTTGNHASNGQNVANGAGKPGKEENRVVVITERFWRANSSSVKLFQEMGCPTSVPLSRGQIRQPLLSYIVSKGLIDPRNQAMVRIAEPHLTHALYPKAPLSEIPAALRREEVLDLLLSKSCIEYHRTSRLLAGRALEQQQRNAKGGGADEELQAGEGEMIGAMSVGAVKPVNVDIKTRQGRKVISLITNLDVYGIDAETFAGDLMRVVGASASASLLPTSTAKHSKSEVFVQGDQRKAVIELLERDHGLDRHLIRVNDMTKK